MRIRLLLLALLAALLPNTAFGQASVYMCVELTTGIDRCQHVSVANPLPVTGTFTPAGTSPEFTPITPGAATATRGVLLGTQYNSTQATFTDGQQGSVQASSRGALLVATGADAFTVAGAVTVSSATAPVATMNSASANSGVTSAVSGVFDDAAPTSITENSFGYMRMSANRNIYSTIRDAAGNERGVNINAANQITASVDAGVTQAPVAPATATATKSDLIGAQATTAAVNPTNGQQSALSSDTNNNLLVSSGGAPNLTIAQVSIATSDTLAIAARALRRSVTIQQITGTQNVFCNQTTATAGNGVVLPAQVGASFTFNTTSAIRCIAISSSQTVAVAETF